MEAAFGISKLPPLRSNTQQLMSRQKQSELEILYEDNHIIAVNKEIGQLVQGDQTGDTPLSELVKDYIKKKYKKPGDVFLGIPHRIDRPVSGVVIFARTSKALTRLNKMFQEKGELFDKIYWAIVEDLPRENEERLIHYIKRNQEKNKSHVYDTDKRGGKKAILDYSLVTKSKKYFLLEIKLHTGRHHQIRAQLSKIGCPIKGDLKYGSPRSNKGGGIGLHARSLGFEHPIKKEYLKIVAPTPRETLWKAFEELVD